MVVDQCLWALVPPSATYGVILRVVRDMWPEHPSPCLALQELEIWKLVESFTKAKAGCRGLCMNGRLRGASPGCRLRGASAGRLRGASPGEGLSRRESVLRDTPLLPGWSVWQQDEGRRVRPEAWLFTQCQGSGWLPAVPTPLCPMS